jgi:hypothetical protein
MMYSYMLQAQLFANHQEVLYLYIQQLVYLVLKLVKSFKIIYVHCH